MKKRTRLGSDPLTSPTGVHALIQDTRKSKQSNNSNESIHKRQRTQKLRPTAEQGLPPDWTRVTFIIRKVLLEKLRDQATFRKNIKALVDEALCAYLHVRKAS